MDSSRFDLLYCRLEFDNCQHSLVISNTGPEVILFLCSSQLKMKFSLLINMKMPLLAFSYLLAEIFS